MVEKTDSKDQLKDRLNKRYRVIFLNDDTLNEIRSFKLKNWHIFLTIFGFLVLTSALTFALIYLTPINNLMTRWIGIENNAIFVDLNKRIYDLEQKVMSQEVYKEGIENLINGVKPLDSGSEDQPVENKVQLSSKGSADLSDFFLSLPVKGTISDTFDVSRGHYGIDIIAPKDSPIKSILPGIVIHADWNPETGNSISVQHPYGLVSVYKHNSSLLKEIGDQVDEGEAIAIIGNTGELSTGPHLHFELWHDGQAINPKQIIN